MTALIESPSQLTTLVPIDGNERSDMTETETECLTMREAVIERGLKTFVEVGTALLAIREERLYRAFGTFEEYCEKRWGMSDRRARMLIDAAATVNLLKTGTIVPVLPATESQARPLTSLQPEQQREVWQKVIEDAAGEKVTAARVEKAVRVLTGQTTNIHVSDDSYEWYTPSEYVDAARRAMGSIDLDPASSAKAQETVKAARFFTKADDGLAQEWAGNVFLNPPYDMPGVAQFCAKAGDSYQSADVAQAIILTNNGTDTNWFHNLARISSALCFTKGRVRFQGAESESLATRQGQVFFYLGNDPGAFANEFKAFGLIVYP